MYMYVCVCIYIYIIYTYENWREYTAIPQAPEDFKPIPQVHMYVCQTKFFAAVCDYIYIYTYIHTYIYIYIYIYTHTNVF